jgi:hypothetical protein
MPRGTKSQQGSSHKRRKAIRLETGPERRADASDARLEERIAMRAYEIYVERGRLPGHDLEHWLQAEQELGRKEE